MGWKQKPPVLLSQAEISAALDRLAAEVARDYCDKNPLLIGPLKGSFVFMADLVRRLDFFVQVEFVRCSSYGAGMESSGQVKMTGGLRTPVKGREVLVVEDIVDTGLTVRFLLDYLAKRNPASLKLCALVDKPSRHRVPVDINYLGFAIPNKFIVGYGLDWDEKYRNLPDICVVGES